jgi:hypothetical protein
VGKIGDVLSACLTSTDQVEKLQRRAALLDRVSLAVEDRLRQLRAHQSELPPLGALQDGQSLQAHVMESNPPWNGERVADNLIPGMITPEECRYYRYIGRFYSGIGEAVELGPWLGRSTAHIVAGLRRSPAFHDRKLHVFDDFVWRPDWMDPHTPPEQRLSRHADFQPLFEHYAEPVRDSIIVAKRRFTCFDGNEDVPPLEWRDRRVEMLYVDCGRTLAANEAWYQIFQPHFVPNRTLIMMQDWRLHRERPRKWCNQTHLFTASKDNHLQLVHELKDGGIATFLYRG